MKMLHASKKTALLSLTVLLACLLSFGIFSATAFAASAQTQTASSGSSDSYAREQLNGAGKVLYDYLKAEITAVANGSATSTVFALDESALASKGVKISWSRFELGVSGFTNDNASLAATAFWAQFDIVKVLDALLHDCPYELYWYDKTTGVSRSCSMRMSGSNDVYDTVSITSPVIIFSVSSEFRPASGYDPSAPSVDRTKTQASQSALTAARAIVAKYAALSDYEKLNAYKDEICSLVSYNNAAVDSSYRGGYGNPWQLLYVFDGDPSTNVVCEGYSKAFQLLCDLSTFKGRVACYTVSGMMSGGTGSGGHMWNLVRMEDGETYLVDVTNCDTGTVGQNGGLFLSGTEGSIASGYLFVINAQNRVAYSYDSKELQLWGSDQSGILGVCEASYVPSAISVEPSGTITYDGQPISAGTANADILYSCKGGTDLTARYNWTVTWFVDANGSIGNRLIAAPVDAGTYWVTVTAKNKTDQNDVKTVSARFTVARAPLHVVSAAALDKIYDGTASVSITSVTLGGVVSGDRVSVELGSGITGTLKRADAGHYDKLTLQALALTGNDAHNYTIFVGGEVTTSVTVNPKNLVGLEGTLILPQGGYTYDATPKTPDVTLKNGDAVLDPALYTLSYANNVHAGNATVTVKSTGGNYIFNDLTLGFSIAKRELTWDASALEAKRLDSDSGEVGVTGVLKLNGLVGDLTYTAPALLTNGLDQFRELGEYEVEVVPADGSWGFDSAAFADYILPIAAPKVVAVIYHEHLFEDEVCTRCGAAFSETTEQPEADDTAETESTKESRDEDETRPSGGNPSDSLDFGCMAVTLPSATWLAVMAACALAHCKKRRI